MHISPVSNHDLQVVGVSHEHSWITESRHQVSAGVLLYVRCTQCRVRRVDLQSPAQVVPAGISRVVGV
ncbi:hypothetical protein LJ754_06770 [Arthrobacter sp. zg-Y40]|nr:hypothetical protein [Arthrobacter sp. zg-Y40]